MACCSKCRSVCRSLPELFEADHKDALLISLFSLSIKFADGAAKNLAPTKCSTTENVLGWVMFGIALIVYAYRHFAQGTGGTGRPRWFRRTRCFIFVCFLLAMHSQPISCSLSSDPKSDDMQYLLYAQSAVMFVLFIVTLGTLFNCNGICTRGDEGRHREDDLILALFGTDCKDATLITFFSLSVKIADAVAENLSPTKCTTAEIVVDWLVFSIVLIVYIYRHRNNPRGEEFDRPPWFRVLRCIIFPGFLLVMHSQPISCSVFSDPEAEGAHILSYAQGATMSALCLGTAGIYVYQRWENK